MPIQRWVFHPAVGISSCNGHSIQQWTFHPICRPSDMDNSSGIVILGISLWAGCLRNIAISCLRHPDWNIAAGPQIIRAAKLQSGRSRWWGQQKFLGDKFLLSPELHCSPCHSTLHRITCNIRGYRKVPMKRHFRRHLLGCLRPSLLMLRIKMRTANPKGAATKSFSPDCKPTCVSPLNFYCSR